MKSVIPAWGVILLILSQAAFAETTDERIDRLEKALAAQKADYERQLTEMRLRIEELEGREGESELDAILRDAEREAMAAEEGGQPAVTASTSQTLLNAFNPRITVFTDLVYRNDSRPVFAEAHDHGHGTEEEVEEDPERIDDRLSLRTFEIALSADIDPFAKAFAMVAFHEATPNEFVVHPEEVYATFETLPFRLRAKLGKFRADIGKMNRLHTHDWPQTSAPLAFTEFLGPEGMNVTGGELSWLAPEGALDAVTLTLGVFNGRTSFANDRRGFSYLGRAQVFEQLSESSYVSVGGSAYWGQTESGGDAFLGGFDVLFRWRPPLCAINTSLFFEGEAYWTDRNTENGKTRSFGAFAMAQYQALRNLYLGVRADYAEPLDRFSTETESAWAGSVWASYYTSEFLRFRAGYEHTEPTGGGEDLNTLWLQVTWVFGSHPVEPFWFNK